jgi:uncharacterized circularly permuted ATP-grasp superfamily protein
MLFDNYQPDAFFDEMFAADGSIRPHYQHAASGLNPLPSDEYRHKQAAVELVFMRGGITFTVYDDS